MKKAKNIKITPEFFYGRFIILIYKKIIEKQAGKKTIVFRTI